MMKINFLLKNKLAVMLEKGFLVTTHKDSKQFQSFLEKLLSICKLTDKLHAKKLLLSRINNNTKIANMLFSISDILLKNTTSGFTVLKKLHHRKGDSALESLLFFKGDSRFVKLC